MSATPSFAATTASGDASGTKAAQAASYPLARSNPRAVDPWGSFDRQCTSFASWSLAHRGVRIDGQSDLTGPKGTARLGDATRWDSVAKAVGYRVVSKPVVGAVAQWHSGETSKWAVTGGVSWLTAGPDGHVGIVRKVLPNGTAVIDDYNGLAPLAFHEFVGKAPRYLIITP
jgi:surface antigen